MKKNMGTADRIIRMIVAGVLAIFFFTNMISGATGIVLISLAAIFVLTSFMGFCPLYAAFGLNSCGVKKST